MSIGSAQLKTECSGGVLTVYISGEIDHHTSKELRNKIDASLGELSPDKLTIDLSGVTFMDSSGLGVVLGRYKLLKERGGSMRIRGASRPVGRILKMAGVYALLGQQDAERGEGHVG